MGVADGGNGMSNKELILKVWDRVDAMHGELKDIHEEIHEVTKEHGDRLTTLEGTAKDYQDFKGGFNRILIGFAIAVLASLFITACEAWRDRQIEASPTVVIWTPTPSPTPKSLPKPSPTPGPIETPTPVPTPTPLPPIVEIPDFVTPTPIQEWPEYEDTPFPVTPRPGVHKQALPDPTYYIPLNRLRVRSGPDVDYAQIVEDGVPLFALAGIEVRVYHKLIAWPSGDEWLCLDEDCTRVVAYMIYGKKYGELRKP